MTFANIKVGDTVRVRLAHRYIEESFVEEVVTRVGREYLYTGTKHTEHRYRRDTGRYESHNHPRQIVTPEWLAIEKREMAVEEFFKALRNEYSPVKRYGLAACEAAVAALASVKVSW